MYIHLMPDFFISQGILNGPKGCKDFSQGVQLRVLESKARYLAPAKSMIVATISKRLKRLLEYLSKVIK